MHKYLIGLVALFSPFVLVNAADDICFSSASSIPMKATTPTGQFNDLKIDQNALVVTDKKTGLMWMRCTRGFEWNEVTLSCENNIANEVTVNWARALQIASEDSTTTGGYTDWRLPNVKELASIVERKCFGPAVNNDVFPGTVPGAYWTNTHVLSSDSAVRVVNFNRGGVTTSSASSLLYLRMVRDVN